MKIILLLIIAWFVLAYFIGAAIVKRQKREADIANYYRTSQKQFNRGFDAKTPETAKDALIQLEIGYEEVKGHINQNSASCYEEDIEDVRSNYIDLMMEKWEKKADRLLHEFIELFLLITNPSFTDIEKAHRSKGKCLAKYDAYWEWTREIYEECRDHLKDKNPWDEAKEHFRWTFEDLVENTADHSLLVWDTPANLSTRQQIEKRLDACITAMQPEYKRKIQLRNHILFAIAEDGTIQRSNLLGKRFEGFIESEVRACYNGLLREEQLVEVKQGARYFVSLTEKGQKNCPIKPHKKAHRSIPEEHTPSLDTAKEKEHQTMIQNQEQLIYEAVIKHFTDEKVEYVDKTQKGGSLYFFDKNVADDLINKGYQILYTEKGTKGTQYRAAWYMRFDLNG